MTTKTIKDFPVVGIGASAGGLEPLETLFDHVDISSGYAYVVIQHLAPNHKSLMDELLARHTNIPIHIIEDGMSVEPDNIYLNPAKHFVQISNGQFKLSEKEDKKLSFPITTFFNSLAEDRQEDAAAIVLSGTGSDGTDGIKFIKEKGGLVLVQDPETAKFDGMPKNAIHSGSADIICRIEQIPKELEKFFVSNKLVKGEKLQSVEHKDQIAKIIQLVKSQTGIDFTGYKFSTVYRRTVRRMGIVGYHTLEDYFQFLKTSASEGLMLGKELLIGVTRFFRDDEVFAAIQSRLIPELIEKAKETQSIRVWVPACSTGEEAYSLAILIKEHLKANRLQFDVTIFATDLDKEAINIAANRIFPASISNEVPPHLLSAYFIPQNKGFRIAKEIRDMIVFSVHNIIQDPPFSKIDLLSCRNFLIYLNGDVQQRLFALFQYTLKPGGFLVLGASESLGEMASHFEEIDKKHKIFTNKNTRKVLQQRVRGARQKPTTQEPNLQERYTTRSPTRTISQIQEFLIREYVPDTLVFSEDYDLMHTTGSMNQWLQLPQGEISTNVIRMLPETISLAFEVAAGKVMFSGEPMSVRNVEMPPAMQERFGSTHLHIHIKKLLTGPEHTLFAASFETLKGDVTPESQQFIDMKMASKEKVGILERELRVNKENLQSTIEELESSNEELQAANEELQSSNEELESVNEELYTVNAEYQQKAAELNEANNDLNNLIQSTEIPILFLDIDLNIRRFTPAIKTILNLMPQDIGRHISHFRTRFQLENFMEKIEHVHETLRPFETTISDLNDHQFMMRVSPFRTLNNEMHGVVLSFVDITAVYNAEKALSLSEESLKVMKSDNAEKTELFELIANNATDLVTVHDLSGTIKYASPSALEVTGHEHHELNGKHLEHYVADEKYRDVWNDAISKISEGLNPGLLNYSFLKKSGETVWFESRIRIILDNSGRPGYFLVTTKDISQRLQYEEELMRLSLIARQTTNAVVITDADGKITFVNDAFEQLTGYDEPEILGKIPGHFLQGEETDPETVQIMREAIQANEGFSVEVMNYTKKGHKYWIKIQCEPMYNNQKEHIGFFSLQYEVTNEKEYRSHIAALNQKLKVQNSKLAEMNSSLEEFAYIASHDLKAPIRNIIGILELMDRKNISPDDSEYQQYNDLIIRSAKDMNRLIESLLEYSRSGVLDESLSTIDLKEAIGDVKNTFSNQLEATGGKVTFKSEVTQARVYPTLFKRLFQNLLGNALKYRSEASPIIEITCAVADEMLEFSVADNGIGIEKNQTTNIFKIFKSLRPNSDSNGIGLSVCKKIAELHHGTIWVESEPGKGSTFYVRIRKWDTKSTE